MTSLDIVICTFNRAASLDACLAAIEAQSAVPDTWSVTVVDNNSTDETADVVARYVAGGRVPGLRRTVEREQGLTPARRHGVLGSAAEWIAFVDDDCLLAPDWVVAALRFAEANTEAGGFGGEVVLEWEREPADYLRRHGWLFAEQRCGGAAWRVESLVGAGVVLNRSALLATGWADGPLLADRIGRGTVSGGDVELSLRLKRAGLDLWCTPSMRLRHRIGAARVGFGAVLSLAKGLGAGAEMVAAATAGSAQSYRAAAASLESERRRHRAWLLDVLRRRTAPADWLIAGSFLRGRQQQRRTLLDDEAALSAVAGALHEAVG